MAHPGWERDWEIMIQKHAGTYLRDLVSVVVCTVDSVDAANRQCNCTPVSGDATSSLPNVQLMATSNDGLVVFPTVGSVVIVGLSTRGNAFVQMYSQVDGLQYITQGGVTITADTLVQIKNTNDSLYSILKDLLTAIESITVTVPSTCLLYTSPSPRD